MVRAMSSAAAGMLWRPTAATADASSVEQQSDLAEEAEAQRAVLAG
jgi:hypothetical protein